MKKNGVLVYVSWKEYEAICGALDQIVNDCEGTDDKYIEDCRQDMQALSNLIRKFKSAKFKRIIKNGMNKDGFIVRLADGQEGRILHAN